MPELHWLGDQDAKRAARRVPYRLLNPVETIGDPNAGNWLIQGDNLEHSQWLSMIYPRLELLRDLLSDDGSIWVMGSLLAVSS